MSVPDPWKTAEFYKYAFGMEVVGETDSSLAEGVFLSDGVINLALLHFKSDEAASPRQRVAPPIPLVEADRLDRDVPRSRA